ncbi:MAG: S46 family peptidase [Bacteroidetes bacterium]|nr:S46 family peptidase [Bacteroidota bacterium]
MKVKLLFGLLFLFTRSLSAKEGMWLPFLLEKMNEKEMKSMGLKITAKDIYDVNKGSLKDAVVIFGGGCTGEVISEQGLVLTNHHCGYGTVQGLSSLQNNYLLQGFWAKNRDEELPCPGLTVTFIARIDDVSAKVKAGIDEAMNETERNKKVLSNIDLIEKEAEKSTGLSAQVKSFYYDNEYYLFLMEKYTDIRLVGFPPNGVGKFGGDTDNWAWPRHTGDFGLFRIYANRQNKPALYAKDNIPYKPKKSFTINIKGVKENDFSMVYGFPGSTAEYLTSDGVAEIMNVLDPARIKLREIRLSIMDEAMRSSEQIFIQYASKQSRIANYYKKWKGELLGLKINNAIHKSDVKKRFSKVGDC